MCWHVQKKTKSVHACAAPSELQGRWKHYTSGWGKVGGNQMYHRGYDWYILVSNYLSLIWVGKFFQSAHLLPPPLGYVVVQSEHNSVLRAKSSQDWRTCVRNLKLWVPDTQGSNKSLKSVSAICPHIHGCQTTILTHALFYSGYNQNLSFFHKDNIFWAIMLGLLAPEWFMFAILMAIVGLFFFVLRMQWHR